jgi:hypothetical protein
MITNTKCQRCLFADRAESNNPCEHNIIDHIKNHKTIKVEAGFNVIENYVCKMGFDKKTYEKNKSSLSIETIKQELVNRACLSYYLLIDISYLDAKQVEVLCEKLLNLSIKPKFISFLLFPHDQNKEKIFTIKKHMGKEIMWKAHSFINEISKNDAIHIALDTNVGKNDTQYLLIYDAKDIDDLDQDTNEINSNIMIIQKPFHYGKKVGSENLNGLFISFNNYNFSRSIDKDLQQAISGITGATILEYGNN